MKSWFRQKVNNYKFGNKQFLRMSNSFIDIGLKTSSSVKNNGISETGLDKCCSVSQAKRVRF